MPAIIKKIQKFISATVRARPHLREFMGIIGEHVFFYEDSDGSDLHYLKQSLKKLDVKVRHPHALRALHKILDRLPDAPGLQTEKRRKNGNSDAHRASKKRRVEEEEEANEEEVEQPRDGPRSLETGWHLAARPFDERMELYCRRFLEDRMPPEEIALLSPRSKRRRAQEIWEEQLRNGQAEEQLWRPTVFDWDEERQGGTVEEEKEHLEQVDPQLEAPGSPAGASGLREDHDHPEEPEDREERKDWNEAPIKTEAIEEVVLEEEPSARETLDQARGIIRDMQRSLEELSYEEQGQEELVLNLVVPAAGLRSFMNTFNFIGQQLGMQPDE